MDSTLTHHYINNFMIKSLKTNYFDTRKCVFKDYTKFFHHLYPSSIVIFPTTASWAPLQMHLGHRLPTHKYALLCLASLCTPPCYLVASLCTPPSFHLCSLSHSTYAQSSGKHVACICVASKVLSIYALAVSKVSFLCRQPLALPPPLVKLLAPSRPSQPLVSPLALSF